MSQASLFAEVDDRPAKARAVFTTTFRALERLRGLPAAALSITACTVADGGTVVVVVGVNNRLCIPGPADSAEEIAHAVFDAVNPNTRRQ